MTRTVSMFIHDQQIAAKDAEIASLRSQLSEARAAHAEAERKLAMLPSVFRDVKHLGDRAEAAERERDSAKQVAAREMERASELTPFAILDATTIEPLKRELASTQRQLEEARRAHDDANGRWAVELADQHKHWRQAIAKAVEAEREACAKVALDHGWHNDDCPAANGHPWYPCNCEVRRIHDAIRARNAEQPSKEGK